MAFEIINLLTYLLTNVLVVRGRSQKGTSRGNDATSSRARTDPLRRKRRPRSTSPPPSGRSFSVTNRLALAPSRQSSSASHSQQSARPSVVRYRLIRPRYRHTRVHQPYAVCLKHYSAVNHVMFRPACTPTMRIYCF